MPAELLLNGKSLPMRGELAEEDQCLPVLVIESITAVVEQGPEINQRLVAAL